MTGARVWNVKKREWWNIAVAFVTFSFFLFLFFSFDGVFAFVGECVLKCRSVYVGVSASLRAELEGGVRILGKAGMQYTKKTTPSIMIQMHFIC